jgi:hypothetical protein
MKLVINKIISSDRFMLVLAVLSLVIIIIAATAILSAGTIERKNEMLIKQMAEMELLTDKLVHLQDLVESKEKKIGLTEVAGVVPALEQMLNSLGIEAKTIKPLEKKMIREFSEEEAELHVEKVDLNRIVNLLYRIENSPVPLKIKNTSVRTTFENPDQFFLHLTVSLIGK